MVPDYTELYINTIVIPGFMELYPLRHMYYKRSIIAKHLCRVRRVTVLPNCVYNLLLCSFYLEHGKWQK